MTGLAIGMAVTGIAAALWIWATAKSSGSAAPAAAGPVSLSAQVPANLALVQAGVRPDIAFSPDGRTIAFSAAEASGSRAIYLRPVDRFDAVKIAGTERGTGPFFSPSGRWIAFMRFGELLKIPVEGGTPVRLCSAIGARGATWLDEDTIVLADTTTGPLVRVSAKGGATPTPLTKLDAAKHEKTHRTPVALPGGKAIVFVVGSNELDTYDNSRIVAFRLDSGAITDLDLKGHSPAYSPTGHLLFVRESTVFAVPFDALSLKTSGSPRQVLQDVAAMPHYGTAEYTIASNGSLIYVPGGDQTEPVAVKRVSRTGTIEALGAPQKPYAQIKMSPDGRRLALVESGANNVLWAYDIAENQMRRLTYRFDVESAAWTHDNSRVTYWSGSEVRTVTADSSGNDEVLIGAAEVGGRSFFPQNWSADGNTLALEVVTPGKGGDIALYSVRDRKLTMVVASRFDEWGGVLSPDGKWLAFASDESNRGEVYVRAIDGSGKYPVSTEGSDSVFWSARGRELVMPAPQGAVAVPFTPGNPPLVGKPVPLFGSNARETLKDARGVAPAPDGSSFVILFRVRTKPLADIRVVTDWTQTLTRIR